MFYNQTLGFNTTIGYLFINVCRKDLFRLTSDVAQDRMLKAKIRELSLEFATVESFMAITRLLERTAWRK